MWIFQTKYKDELWEDNYEIDDKYDLDEVKIFARIIAPIVFPKDVEYRIVSRLDTPMGSSLPVSGTWRIQIRYRQDISLEDRYFDTLAVWGDVNVCVKAAGYKSYDQAFDAIMASDFMKFNPTFVWRIIQD